MSFPYYRFFPGDYLRDTRRLTILQHGAYHLLIHEYMASGKPLRGDLDAMCRICGALSGEERNAVEFILVEFFDRDGPLWRHKRCDTELAKLNERSDEARKSVNTRWGRSTNVIRTHSGRNTNQNQNQKLEVEVEVKKKQKKNQIPALSDSEIEIKIPIIGGEFPISKTYAIELDVLYPDADVRQTLREIRGWNLSNPTKRKTASGVLRHVNSWFAKVQNG